MRHTARVRLALYSDLHLEFADFEPPALDVDVVVLAGDIAPKLQGLAFAEQLALRCPVVYVLGNHEYYGTHTRLVEKLKALASSRVHILENDSVSLHGVRFLGATLWTDFALTGDADRARDEAARLMNDYRRIRSAEHGYKRFTPTRSFLMHHRSRAFLERGLAAPPDGPTVVVTHHAPSIQSVPEHERSLPIASAYASDLGALVADSQAALWLHGHTHRNVDYVLGTTRVCTNQRGYPDEPASGFDPARVWMV